MAKAFDDISTIDLPHRLSFDVSKKKEDEKTSKLQESFQMNVDTTLEDRITDENGNPLSETILTKNRSILMKKVKPVVFRHVRRKIKRVAILNVTFLPGKLINFVRK